MTIDELKQLREQINHYKQDVAEAEKRADDARLSKNQSEDETRQYLRNLVAPVLKIPEEDLIDWLMAADFEQRIKIFEQSTGIRLPSVWQSTVDELRGRRRALVRQTRLLAVAEARLTRARRSLDQAQQDYERRLEALIPGLDAKVPLVLLPVRIETRFCGPREGRVELRVRVYPDDIQVNAHEWELTAEELEAGIEFDKSRPGNDEARKQAWAELAGRFGPQRAAWIARATDPRAAHQQDGRADPWSVGGIPWTPDGRTDPTNPRIEGERATVLPDRWHFIGYRANDVRLFSEHGDLIPDPLPLWYGAPPTDEQNPEDSPDNSIAWLTDFDQAKAVGMAHSISLPEDQAAQLRRLVVVGTKGALDAAESSQRFRELLAAHQYTWGLSFVPQGTPTNNTAQARSGFQERDPRFEASFAAQEQSTTLNGDTDGVLAARALGYPAPDGRPEDFVFAHVQGADGQDQADAAHMNHALWPATWGYFLKQMMGPKFNGLPLENWQRYFVRYVRGRGPLPALRVGDQPYGVLPVTSLEAYPVDANRALTPSFVAGERGLIDVLRTLRRTWRAGLPNAPRIGRTAEQNANPNAVLNDLIQALAQTPSSSQVAGRQLFGPDYLRNLLWYQSGIEQSKYESWKPNFWDRLQENFKNYHNAKTGSLKLDDSVLAKGVYAGAHFPYDQPLVTQGPLSETDPLPLQPNYIERLRDAASLHEVHALAPDTLLFSLLRVALLQAWADAALQLGAKLNATKPPRPYQEPELVDMGDLGDLPTTGGASSIRPASGLFAMRPGRSGTFTAWRYLKDAKVDGYNTPMEEFIRNGLEPNASQNLESIDWLRDYRDALSSLSTLPTARLQRLFTECLDLSSHRLDAWITSFATYRLQQMRDSTPTGLTLGGYGWVEWESSPLAAAKPSTGYIQAPSLAHAATAAVLRSGYLSHNSDATGDLLALDLSSRRVRTATWLLEGVRQGQPLGALLGYRFERMLAEHGLQTYIDGFRRLAPLVANKLTSADDPDRAVEAVAARNVVDGLGLLNKGLEGIGTQNDKATLTKVLDDLKDALDSVSDLMVAEGVYQTMQGNPVRAGGALTAIAAGEAPPPEPEVVRTARSGVAVTHRLLAAFDADPSRAAVFVRHWPPGPRGQAEPALNAWAARLFSTIPHTAGGPQPLTGMLNRGTSYPLFSPQQIVFWFRAHGPHGSTKKRTLEGLDLCPLDLLYAQRPELEQRILFQLSRTNGFNTIELVFEDPGEPDVALSPSQISLQSVLEIARAARSLISNARALAPDDVAWPEQPEGRVDESELGKRLQQARTGLETALGKLRDSLPVETGETGSLPPVAGQLPRGDLKDIRSALLALAAFGVQGAIPAPPTGNAQQDGKALHLQAEQVAAQAQERLAASKDPDLTIAGRIEALFGGGFRVLPVFQPDEDLEAAVAERTRIGDATPDVVIPWLQQMALLRPAAARLETVQMYTYANDRRGIGSVRVAQLPLPDKVQPDEPLPDGVQPKEPWVALRPRAKSSIPGGRLSMAIYQPLGNVQLGEDKKVAGLMIDQWVEVVPNKEETTAVAFHYDAPAARPPQSILLAVPPRAGLQWSLDILEKTLLETLELAKLRTVDLHSLPSVGHFLPALFMASNQGVADETENPGHDPHGDTISTNFVVKADGKSIWHQ